MILKSLPLFALLAIAATGQVTNKMTATIASGQSLSDIVELRPQGRAGACTLATIVMPSAWTSANITFQGSVDGQTFGNVYDDSGAEVTVAAAASRVIVVTASYFWGIRWIRLRSGTSSVPVNQAAQRTLTLYCRE